MLIGHMLIGAALQLALSLPADVHKLATALSPYVKPEVSIEVVADHKENIDIVHIFRQIKISAAPRLGTKEVHLRIIKTKQPDAYTHITAAGTAEIVISTGLIEMMRRDKDFIASIIAHEFIHVINDDAGDSDRALWCSSSPYNSRQCEKVADQAGQYLMGRAGYDVCKMSMTFRILYTNFGPNEEDIYHPLLTERMKYTACVNGIPPKHVTNTRWYH